MLAIYPDQPSLVETLQSIVIPFIDLLMDDISIEIAEPWPSRTVFNVMPTVEWNGESIHIVFRNGDTGEALSRLAPIPVADFLKGTE
jgi:hypothetical protein